MNRINVALATTALAFSASLAYGQQFYNQTNLTSDGFIATPNTDRNLVNAWGLSAGPTSPFWVSDNGTGKATLYDGTGKPQPLIVSIPATTSGGTSAPTGNVFNRFNSSGDFGGNVFLFVSEDGGISGWKPANGTAATLVVDNSSSSAVYKGAALGSNASGNFLYAANFRSGKIDVFDSSFNPTTLAGNFSDPNIPGGYAPFNIANIGGTLYVSYAKQDADKEDDVAGPGNGFVDTFDTNGNFLSRFATQAALNAPWGLVQAPSNFGDFSNDILVGNFGDGRINVFDPDGTFLGQLSSAANSPITIDGLWALAFGNGAAAGPANSLFFTAGPNNENNGLFGAITVVPEPLCLSLLATGAICLLRRRHS